MAARSPVEDILKKVDESKRHRLGRVLDYDRDGVDYDLGLIASKIKEWKGRVGDCLGLTDVEMQDIEERHILYPVLKRRAALQLWKERYNTTATYENLIRAFYNAGSEHSANVVVEVINGDRTAPQVLPEQDQPKDEVVVLEHHYHHDERPDIL